MDVEGTFRGRLVRSIAATAKNLLPKALLREVQQYRAYGKDERPLYLKIRISDRLGFTDTKRSRVPETARAFLFVCFGNIMRSPMCEALMNRELAHLDNPQFTVLSAGLDAISGRAAHPWAIAAARDFGISLEEHRARLLTPALVEQATVIFTMDYQNQVQLLSRYPETRHKAFLLCAYAGEGNRSAEIPDPFYLDQEGTRGCYQTLATCIRNLVAAFP